MTHNKKKDLPFNLRKNYACKEDIAEVKTALLSNDTASLDKLLTAHPDIMSCRIGDLKTTAKACDFTLLTAACWSDDVEDATLEFILKHPAFDATFIEYADGKGYTPAQVCIECEYDEKLVLLLHYGLNPDSASYNNTPLMVLAAMHDAPNAANILTLAGANTDITYEEKTLTDIALAAKNPRVTDAITAAKESLSVLQAKKVSNISMSGDFNEQITTRQRTTGTSKKNNGKQNKP